MSVPDSIKQLVERFEANREAYRSSRYNETRTRREFIDPFFKALGWDIDNEQGYAEAYKDVIHEPTLEVEGETKAPVKRMLALHNQHPSTLREKEMLQRKIAATDRQIDALVYELSPSGMIYELSEEEIAIVEGIK